MGVCTGECMAVRMCVRCEFDKHILASDIDQRPSPSPPPPPPPTSKARENINSTLFYFM